MPTREVSIRDLRKWQRIDAAVSIITAAFLVWLGVFSVTTAHRADQLVARVSHTAETQVAECQDLNTMKASLSRLFVVIPPPHENSAQKAYIAGLERQAGIAFARIKCPAPDP